MTPRPTDPARPDAQPIAQEDDRTRVAFRMWWIEMEDHTRTKTACRRLEAANAVLAARVARLSAALTRYTDLVDLHADDYRATYGAADFPDAMDDVYRAAKAALEGTDADAG